MDILLFLVPLSLLVGGVWFGVFLWASRNRQFDDLDLAAWRALQDDPPAEAKPADKA